MSEKPTWISHRGYSTQADENTREAFDAALEMGFLHLETDLRATSDGHLVLAHDRSLERIAGRTDFVDQMDRSSLETVILKSGGHLMFFDEFIERYAACNWTFDIKPETGGRVIEILDSWIKANGARSWMLVQARFLFWKVSHEKHWVELMPGSQIYAQQAECWRAGLAVLSGVMPLAGLRKNRVYALPAKLGPIDCFRRKYVERYHRYGARVCAFLPDTEDDARAAIEAGFDEVLTNGAMIPAT